MTVGARRLIVSVAVVVMAAIALVYVSHLGEPRPWEVVKQPRASDTSFGISVDSGECSPPESALNVEVEEDIDSVTVTALVDEGSGTSDDCLTYMGATVQLDSPVGQRPLKVGK